jgi:hypothetical protein
MAGKKAKKAVKKAKPSAKQGKAQKKLSLKSRYEYMK